MNFTKQSLKATVIKVFENGCSLGNYEMVALVEAFEDLRQLKEGTDAEMFKTAHTMLLGALNFLAAAHRITEEQNAQLVNLAYRIDG